jgi:hexosaminidase
VANFTAALISSVAKTLPSKIFSTGGDKVNAYCYAKDSETQADLRKTGRTLEEALNAFTQRTHSALLALGKTPVVWEGQFASVDDSFAHKAELVEMVLKHNVTLDKNTVVMSVSFPQP